MARVQLLRYRCERLRPYSVADGRRPPSRLSPSFESPCWDASRKNPYSAGSPAYPIRTWSLIPS